MNECEDLLKEKSSFHFAPYLLLRKHSQESLDCLKNRGISII